MTDLRISFSEERRKNIPDGGDNMAPEQSLFDERKEEGLSEGVCGRRDKRQRECGTG